MADDNAPPAAGSEQAGQAATELSAEQAAQAIAPAAAAAQRQWLSTAVNIANAIRNNQRVTHGMFEDLRQLREQFEELERARLVLSRLGGDGQGGQGQASDAPPAG